MGYSRTTGSRRYRAYLAGTLQSNPQYCLQHRQHHGFSWSQEPSKEEVAMPGFDRTGTTGGRERGTGRGMGILCANRQRGKSRADLWCRTRRCPPRGGGTRICLWRKAGDAASGHGMWMSVPPVNMTKAQEIAVLQEHASLLQEELKQLNARIEETQRRSRPEVI